MSFSNKSLIAAAFSTAVLGLAASASAQDGPPPPPPPGAQGPGAHPGMDRMRERRADHEAERIKALHDALNIRADQEPAFQAFVASLKPKNDQPGAWGAARKAPEPLAATTPERLDQMEARIQARDQKLQARITAIKTFYAALTPDQKHTFDALPMLHNAFMERGPHDGPGMRGPGMGRPGMGGPGQPPMGPAT